MTMGWEDCVLAERPTRDTGVLGVFWRAVRALCLHFNWGGDLCSFTPKSPSGQGGLLKWARDDRALLDQ